MYAQRRHDDKPRGFYAMIWYSWLCCRFLVDSIRCIINFIIRSSSTRGRFQRIPGLLSLQTRVAVTMVTGVFHSVFPPGYVRVLIIAFFNAHTVQFSIAFPLLVHSHRALFTIYNTGDHSKKDNIWLVKSGKYIGFWWVKTRRLLLLCRSVPLV